MGRRRSAANSHYPENVYPSRGWLFYRDPDARDWHKICRLKDWDTKEARDTWSALSTTPASKGTVAAMLDAHQKYRLELVRSKQLSARTFEDNTEHVRYLKLAFGSMLAHQVNGRHCTSYLQKRTWQPRPRKGPAGELVPQPPRRAPVRANKEISFLSTTYAWAMGSPDFPLVTANPCTGITKNPESASDRCPEVWEIEAAKAKASALWAWILDLAYAGGQRGVDTRLMRKTQLRPDGIHVGQTKTGAQIIIEWTSELQGIVLALLAYSDEVERRRRVVSPYVITARSGGAYTRHGWKTNMYKIVRAAIADPANPLEQPFSFHNLRARSATDEEELMGTNPQHRLGHTKRATTDIYMRGKRPKKVKALPLRKAS